MSSPPDPAPAPWPEPAAFEANAAGRLIAGQRQMLLGDPTPPPSVSLTIVAVAAVGGAAFWWHFGFGAGITVILVGANIGLAVMSMNLDRRRRRRRLRSDLGHPAIGGGIGEIVIAAGRVDIRSGVAAIELGLGTPTPPPPGWYDMYWLEHPGAQRWNADRVLLSGRPRSAPVAAGGDPTHPGGVDPLVTAEIEVRLREVLGRTEDELAFNRNGQLSPPQRDELRRRARKGVWARLTGVGVGTLVALLMLAAAIVAWRRPPAEDEYGLAGGIISAVLGLAVVWATVRAALRLPRAVAAAGHPPPLARASGPVTTKLVDWENNTWTVAVDDGPTFRVTADVARAFGTPVPYTVFYVLRGREPILLAAEPLRHRDDGAGGGR